MNGSAARYTYFDLDEHGMEVIPELVVGVLYAGTVNRNAEILLMQLAF